jgi:hypothetical protein
MVVNLYGRHANIDSSIQTIARVFGKNNVWAYKPTTAGNTIVLAFQTVRQLEKNDLVDIAKKIQLKWSIPTDKWAKALAPVHIALT